MRAKDTVATYFVRAAVARLDAAATSRVLATAGLPAELLQVAHARVPAASFAALWLAVAHELDDEFFGLDARRMKVGSFALIAQAALHRGTLGRALTTMLKGFRVLLDDISATLTHADQQATLTVQQRIKDPAAARFAEETLLVMLHGLACWLCGKRIPLLSVGFSGSNAEQAAEHQLIFTEHLHYGAAQTQLRFDVRLLAAPVIQNPQTLRLFLQTAPQSVFLKYRNNNSCSARVRHHLRKGLQGGDWPQLDDIARSLAVANTTLRRKLAAEGASFQDIKDGLRRDLAIEQLCSSDCSVAELALQLGFQDSSAFQRAFKKWNGMSPGAYRRHHRRLPQAANGVPAATLHHPSTPP